MIAILQKHGLDFDDAAEMFERESLDLPDVRRAYGENRIVSVGHLDGRMVVCVWTARSDARHIISLRKANAGNKRSTGIDWTIIDRLEGAPDPDSPELTEADFARGEWRRAGKPIDRPALTRGKDLVSIRIDRAVLAKFREGGPGWQGRINDILRKAVGL